jgi:methionyl-tRNA synthetase
MRTVLWALAEVIRHLAILTQPFMPGSSAKILDQLAVSPARRCLSDLGPDGANLVPGTPLPGPAPVFPRYVEPEGA